jgi:hypothetical protein
MVLEGATIISIIINQSIKSNIMFKNWKTTLSGIIAALPIILRLFGIEIGHEITDICTGTGLTGMGLFSKDNNVTGGTINQNVSK